MLQNPCKTLGFKKNMLSEIPPGGGGGGKPYPASGLAGCITLTVILVSYDNQCYVALTHGTMGWSVIVVFPDHTHLFFKYILNDNF